MASTYNSGNITTYDNEVLTTKFEQNLTTTLDMSQFTTVNYELSQNPGMTYVVLVVQYAVTLPAELVL